MNQKPNQKPVQNQQPNRTITITASRPVATTQVTAQTVAPQAANKTPLPSNVESQQLQQRLWVKEQEVSALKVQNRHLIAKLEESEKKAEHNAQPQQINTQLIAAEIQNQIKPLIGEIEKSLKESFDMLKSTMRGIYQQSQRAQQAVEDIGAHAREVETRHNEARKADQVYYQEKILSMVTSFGDRIERQLENRLRNLAVVELMNTKQNEVLSDIEMIKGAISELIISNEGLRQEMRRNTNLDQVLEKFAENNLRKNEIAQSNTESEKILKETKLHVEQDQPQSEEENSIESPITLDYL
jgi:hypothetical protein